MNENKPKNKWLPAIFVIAVLSVLGGLLGEIVFRTFVWERYFLPFDGELSYGTGDFRGQNLVIRDAKKVIVQQDDKVREVAANFAPSLMGIFQKKAAAKDGRIALDDIYHLDQALSQAIVLTSDGWLVTAYSAAPADKNRPLIDRYKDLVIIDSRNKIYPIKQAVADAATGYIFLNVEATDLSAPRLSGGRFEGGEAVLIPNWNNEVFFSNVLNGHKQAVSGVRSSDGYRAEIVLRDTPRSGFTSSALLGLSGEIYGLVGQDGKITDIASLRPAINSLLKDKQTSRLSLGINYIDLSQVIYGQTVKGALVSAPVKGDAVSKDSPLFGQIKAGDIITSYNFTEIDSHNSLDYLVSQTAVGSKVMIGWTSNSVAKELEITLK